MTLLEIILRKNMPGFWITYLYPTNSMGTGGCHEASNGGSGTEGGV
jgi:hypothetical protein